METIILIIVDFQGHVSLVKFVHLIYIREQKTSEIPR